jgi:hypothetical protein
VTVLKVEFTVTPVFSEAIDLRGRDRVDFVPCDSKTVPIPINLPNTVIVGNQCWCVVSG